MPLVISPKQSGFVQGREISDNILIDHDMVSELDRRTRSHNIIFKLDMMKAFDRVSWEFLSRLLLRFGFHPHIVAFVLNNLRSSWFSVLINGKPHGFFQASRGVKQGDPLSPILFILVSKALSRGLSSLLSLEKLKAYAQSRGTVTISHLTFADDIVIFTRGIANQCDA
ncbi:secreted RxLR effector protein 78-like [Coffea arabica]|uniref:Secreted RxLR effector protein 78-like n=1 Tax=Coffea arabica TaxID=13443 RepID=A0ABM4WPZ0_COFAR